MHKFKPVSESVSINAIIAAVCSFLVMFSQTAVQIINFMIPWFTVALIFFILLILIFQVFGAKDTDIFGALKNKTSGPAIIWTIIGVGIVIMLAAFGSVAGQKLTEAGFQQGTSINATSGSGAGTSDFTQNLYATLFNPKVLGLMLIFAVAIFAVLLLTA